MPVTIIHTEESIANHRLKLVRDFYPAELRQGRERESYTHNQMMKRLFPNSYFEKKLKGKLMAMSDEEVTSFWARLVVKGMFRRIKSKMKEE